MCIKSSRMETGVITEIPLRFLRMLSSLSPIISRPIGVTSHTTPLAIRRGVGGKAERVWRLDHHLFVQVKALQCDDTLLFLREKRLFGKLFYPNFRIESLAFYHKEEILKHIFLSFLSSKITT